jgi:hypothetical protein
VTFRSDIIDGMDAVEREFRAATLGMSRLMADMLPDPTILRGAQVVPADVRACHAGLESTYLVRMFAVFEEALRDVREIVYLKQGPIKTYALLNQCASRQKVKTDHLAGAHRVRDFRNRIVHGGSAPPVTLPQARAWLCSFFGSMPKQWQRQ